jgi:hypothetical protein
MPDETGWMLEKSVNGANWFIGVIDGILGWTTDPNKGLRLSRREDAEAIATICEDAEKISEHLWPDMSKFRAAHPDPTPQPTELERKLQVAHNVIRVELGRVCDIEQGKCDICKCVESSMLASVPQSSEPPQPERCGAQGKRWTCSLPKGHNAHHRGYHLHDFNDPDYEVWLESSEPPKEPK